MIFLLLLFQCAKLNLKNREKTLSSLANRGVESFIEWGISKFAKEPILKSQGLRNFIHIGDLSYALGCSAPLTQVFSEGEEQKKYREYDIPELCLLVYKWDEEKLSFNKLYQYNLSLVTGYFDSSIKIKFEYFDDGFPRLNLSFGTKRFMTKPIAERDVKDVVSEKSNETKMPADAGAENESASDES